MPLNILRSLVIMFRARFVATGLVLTLALAAAPVRAQEDAAEGKKFWLSGQVKDEFRENSPTALQIIRNLETAIQKVGGKACSWT